MKHGMFCSCTPEVSRPAIHGFSLHISSGEAHWQNSQPVIWRHKAHLGIAGSTRWHGLKHVPLSVKERQFLPYQQLCHGYAAPDTRAKGRKKETSVIWRPLHERLWPYNAIEGWCTRVWVFCTGGASTNGAGLPRSVRLWPLRPWRCSRAQHRTREE